MWPPTTHPPTYPFTHSPIHPPTHPPAPGSAAHGALKTAVVAIMKIANVRKLRHHFGASPNFGPAKPGINFDVRIAMQRRPGCVGQRCSTTLSSLSSLSTDPVQDSIVLEHLPTST